MSGIIRRVIVWIFFLFITFRLFTGYAIAANHDVEHAQSSTWVERISELNQTLKERRSEKEKLLRKGDKLAEEIKQEKLISQSIGNRRLDSMLRESHQLVSKIESVSRQIDEIKEELTEKYPMAITALVNQLEKETQEKKKKALIKQLLKFIEIYETLIEPEQFQIPRANLEIREYDTPYEIRKKADFLADQTALIKAKMFQIDAQINNLEREKALRDKVKRFADEINFFDSALFVEERQFTQRGSDNQEDNTDIPGDDISPPDDAHEPILGDVLDQGTTPYISFQGAAPESSPSDLVLSSSSIDNWIELLRQQKIQLEDRIGQLKQKMQIFYKKAEEAVP
jgi:hypothetical protein